MSDERILYSGTVQYLRANLTANDVLDAQPVEFSLDRTTWYAGLWAGDPGTTRTAEILLGGPDFPTPQAGRTYEIFVRITDNPEIPIMSVGLVQIR